MVVKAFRRAPAAVSYQRGQQLKVWAIKAYRKVRIKQTALRWHLFSCAYSIVVSIVAICSWQKYWHGHPRAGEAFSTVRFLNLAIYSSCRRKH